MNYRIFSSNMQLFGFTMLMVLANGASESIREIVDPNDPMKTWERAKAMVDKKMEERQRNLPLVPGSGGHSLMTEQNAEFTLRLFQALASKLGPTENLIFSPVNIALLLSKLSLGVNRATAEEILKALHISTDPNPTKNEDDVPTDDLQLLLDQLESLEGQFNMFVKSALFMNINIPVKEHYESELNELHSDKINFFDENLRDIINRWVAKETDDEISSIDTSIDDTARFLTTDAFYLENKWDKKFEVENTTMEEFTLPDGTINTVPMMKQTNRFYYGKFYAKALEFVELPLATREMSMFVFTHHERGPIPLESKKLILANDENKPPTPEEREAQDKTPIEERMTKEYLINPHKEFKILPAELITNLRLPKFDVRNTHSLKEVLQTLGLSQIFSKDETNFKLSDMDGLALDQMIHSSYLTVSESGSQLPTEPKDEMDFGKRQKKDVSLAVTGPFVFFIRDNKTKMILTMGKINNPQTERPVASRVTDEL